MSAVKTPLAVARIPGGSRDSQPDWPAAGSLAAPAERASSGKAARGLVPREGHAALDLAFDRPDPVDLLDAQARTRLPELVPVRYGRMLVSPFAYFRGAALPMAADLAATPVTGFTVQACGDAHLGNFGVFAGPEGRLIFDINDFDETLPGPWEWDVKRLATSVEIAGRQNGFSVKQRRKVALTTVSSYREAMLAFARKTKLDVRDARLDLTDIRAELKSAANGKLRKAVGQGMISARTRDSLQAMAKLTAVVDGRRQIVADPPLIVPVGDLAAADEAAERTGRSEPAIVALLAAYRHALREDSADLLSGYELGSLARKVVGVGSVGTRCWIVLMLDGHDSDPLFLQVREAEPSVLSEFAGPSQYDNQAQRVVVGQRFIQAAPDAFLGWVRVAAGTDGRRRDYYVRQLRDWKLSADLAGLSPGWLRRFARYCGWTLARAHARTGDRFAMAGYLGTSVVFDEAIADFAASYANQNERDYAELGQAARSGRIIAKKGL
ncbi:MAG TPA: DUF2252 domain-containing protein [Streptosporangiaceae bacterium]|nr:DUF2252 domain-containing protein [Streptosporangiaceae bacterium]